MLNQISRSKLPSSGAVLALILLSVHLPADEQKHPTETRTEIHFDQVTPASKLLGMPVAQAKTQTQGNHEAIGIVRDLLIDVNSGFVPFAVVRPVPETGSQLWVLPISCGKIAAVGSQADVWELQDEEIQQLKRTSLDAGSLPANEDQATAWSQAFDQSRPWTQDAAERQAPEFRSLRSFFWQKVENSSEEVLGTVTELVLDMQHQRVAYTLLTPAGVSASETVGPQDLTPRILVPLAAYVNSKKDRTWLLELPRRELEIENQVPPQTFPRRIPRTWIEYVSVRYGADVEKGIQPLQQPAKRDQ